MGGGGRGEEGVRGGMGRRKQVDIGEDRGGYACLLDRNY